MSDGFKMAVITALERIEGLLAELIGIVRPTPDDELDTPPPREPLPPPTPTHVKLPRYHWLGRRS